MRSLKSRIPQKVSNTLSSVSQHSSAVAPIEKMHEKAEIQRKLYTRSLKCRIPHRGPKDYLFSVSNHISAAGTNRKYAVESCDSPRKCVYTFADIQNPKRVFKTVFSASQHISRAAPIETMHYKTEIHRTFVYASAEIQNPKQVPKI